MHSIDVYPPDTEIERVMRDVRSALKARATRYPDMTYEDGIEETLEWLLSNGSPPYSASDLYDSGRPVLRLRQTIVNADEEV